MLTHKDLVDIGHKCLKRFWKYKIIFKEISTVSPAGEIPDVIGFSAYGKSILIECKASRSDFLRDRAKQFRISPSRGMGRYRFYLAPKGVISEADLPLNWGLIEVSEKGRANIVVNPYCSNPYGNIWRNGFEQNMEAERAFLYSVIRRFYL